MSPDTIKDIVRHHLPLQLKFSRKKNNIDDSHDSSKLFSTILGAYRVILGSAYPDRQTLLILLLKDITTYRTRPGKNKKQYMWYLTIVYLQLKIITNTSI